MVYLRRRYYSQGSQTNVKLIGLLVIWAKRFRS